MARRSLARGLAGALLAIAGAAPLTAQQSPIAVPPGAPFSVRHFDTSNGLPQNSVTALDQTRDGAMWIGTFGGLCRFDGTVWQVFDAVATPALDDSRVLAMRAAADGTLWFATEAGTVLRWCVVTRQTTETPRGRSRLAHVVLDQREPVPPR